MPVYIIRCWHLVLDAHYYIILDAYLFGALSNIICFTASLKPDPQNTQKAQKVTSNRFSTVIRGWSWYSASFFRAFHGPAH